MDYAVELDVPFLADALEGLTRRNVRHFRSDLSLAQKVLRRMVDKDYQWIRETPDTWQDVVQLANPEKKGFDCEDFAAAFAALMVICFGEARVGIRRVDTHLCHALAGQGSAIYDICPLFGMPGVSRGHVEWRSIKEKPMIAEGIALITSGVRRLMTASEEKPASEGLDLDTGTSLTSSFASLLPPAALARLGMLEDQLKDVTKQRDAFKKERDALKKERDALKKGLTEMTASRNDQSARRISAETAQTKTKEELNAKLRLLAEVQAFRSSCEKQLQQVIARSPNEETKNLAREGLQRLQQESPEDYLDAFEDPNQRDQAWEMLATGAAHLETLPKADCDACERGEPCTAGADDANGDEPPENTSGPESDDEVGGYEEPLSSERPLSLSGCGGSCPR